MSLSDDERWILPENLKRQERREVEQIEQGIDAPVGDFGSYHALFTGKNTESVKEHAVLDAHYLSSYVRQAKILLDAAGCPETPDILDVGCGPGAVSAALAEVYPRGRVLGVDISESAIAYAKKLYPRCEFLAAAVDEKMALPRKFDVIHAREFYPFTRTGDVDFHRRYFDIFAANLAPNGLVLVSLVDGEKNLSKNIAALSAHLEGRGLSPLRLTFMAHPKLARWLPLALARTATKALLSTRGRRPFTFYLTMDLTR